MNHRLAVLAAAVSLALLAGCKQESATHTDAGNAVAGIQDAVDAAAADAVEAGAVPAGSAPLQPNQSVQGTIEADLGKGSQSFRSLSTKLADDLDKQVEQGMAGNAKAQAALDDANAKLKKLGAGVQVSADDVQGIIGGMAGKTIHESQVMHIGIIKRQAVNLLGRAADGGVLQLNLNFDENSLTFQDATLSYQPDPKSMFDRYETGPDNRPEISIERFEKNADGTFAIAGSFKASNMPAARMAKKLKGDTLASASGTFKFDALPVREMPKFGG